MSNLPAVACAPPYVAMLRAWWRAVVGTSPDAATEGVLVLALRAFGEYAARCGDGGGGGGGSYDEGVMVDVPLHRYALRLHRLLVFGIAVHVLSGGRRRMSATASTAVAAAATVAPATTSTTGSSARDALGECVMAYVQTLGRRVASPGEASDRGEPVPGEQGAPVPGEPGEPRPHADSRAAVSALDEERAVRAAANVLDVDVLSERARMFNEPPAWISAAEQRGMWQYGAAAHVRGSASVLCHVQPSAEECATAAYWLQQWRAQRRYRSHSIPPLAPPPPLYLRSSSHLGQAMQWWHRHVSGSLYAPLLRLH